MSWVRMTKATTPNPGSHCRLGELAIKLNHYLANKNNNFYVQT